MNNKSLCLNIFLIFELDVKVPDKVSKLLTYMRIRDVGIIFVTKIELKQVYISIVETCLYFHAIFCFRNLSTIFKVLSFTGKNNKTMRSLHVISSRLAIPKISVTYLFSPVI